jgi:hypothetical protein
MQVVGSRTDRRSSGITHLCELVAYPREQPRSWMLLMAMGAGPKVQALFFLRYLPFSLPYETFFQPTVVYKRSGPGPLLAWALGGRPCLPWVRAGPG